MSPDVPLVARGIVTDIIRAKDNSSATGMAEEDVRAFTKAILALVQPAAGITLTPEEAAMALFAIEYTRHRAVLGGRDQAQMKALEAKLEASA